jgi:hypothetical protein
VEWEWWEGRGESRGKERGRGGKKKKKKKKKRRRRDGARTEEARGRAEERDQARHDAPRLEQGVGAGRRIIYCIAL